MNVRSLQAVLLPSILVLMHTPTLRAQPKGLPSCPSIPIQTGTFENVPYAVYRNASGFTYFQATNAAQSCGGALVAITSADEQTFVFGLLTAAGPSGSEPSAWLGAENVGGTFEWASGEDFSYDNFAPGEPNGFPGDVLQIRTAEGFWNDRSTAFSSTLYIVEFPPQYSIGGVVAGLAGSGLTLQNNGADDLAIAADGPFTFATPITQGETYAVAVSAQPTGPAQTCTVTDGSGAVGSMDVENVAVNCTTDTFAVGGTVSGLREDGVGDDLVLTIAPGNETVTLTANGAFQFPTALPDATAYSVAVETAPTLPGETCTIENGAGTLNGANVSAIAVTCTTDTTDLAITKTDGMEVIVAGDPVTYVITIANNGPRSVTGAAVMDLLPPELTSATWECLPQNAGVCPASGTGDIDVAVDIPVGESVTFTLTAATPDNFQGVIVNEAMVAAPASLIDSDNANNSATDRSATGAVFMDGFEEPDAMVGRLLDQN